MIKPIQFIWITSSSKNRQLNKDIFDSGILSQNLFNCFLNIAQRNFKINLEFSNIFSIMSASRQEPVSSYYQFSHENNTNPKNFQFTLTSDQCIILQHYLPKGYALLVKRRPGAQHKRDRGSHYYHDSENLSKISGVMDNPSEKDCRSKRNRIKKVDKYIQDQMPRPVKRTETSKSIKSENINPFQRVLNGLKKSENSYPFLEPVDPKLTGASNYFDIIEQPMDLSTVQINYNRKVYDSFEGFNQDIRKIWQNSYTYNDSKSKIYKMTRQMEKLHNKLIEDVYKWQRDQIQNGGRQKNSRVGSKRQKAVIDSDSNDQSQKVRK